MKMSIIALSLVLAIAVFAMCGCEHTLTIKSTPLGMYGESNRSGIEGTKTIDKDGNETMTFSSKKGASTLDNIITILSLGLIKR